ncbi:hypothetical protein R1flu_024702 [Riccia fluitans]|uniref:Ribosomal protein S14 n=1 Tax=Riccia fluitans TaxID=41844 RepID=A0ABD1XVM7_9MARC
MDYNPKLGRVPTARRRALAPVNATAKVCTGDEGIVRRRRVEAPVSKVPRVQFTLAQSASIFLTASVDGLRGACLASWPRELLCKTATDYRPQAPGSVLR